MVIRPILFIAALLLASQTAEAQQSQTNQPAQVQAKPVPCTPKQPLPKWFHPEKLPAIRDFLAQIQKSGGGSIDTSDIVRSVERTAPCPPNAPVPTKASPVVSPLTTTAPPPGTPESTKPQSSTRLPESKTVLRCDPSYPADKDFPLFFPLSDDYANPLKPNTPEFDEWSLDSEVKTACHDVKVNPKTRKYFVQR